MIIQLLSTGKNGTVVYTDLVSAMFALGYIFPIEMLYLTIYFAVSVAGIFGNVLSVCIFFRPAFYSATSPPLYSYLRYEAMIGIVGNLASTIYGLSVCADVMPLTNNPVSQWIQVYIAITLYNISYYAKFLMEIAVVIDRIFMLAPSIGSHWGLNDFLKIKRPYLVFIGICIFSTLVNYPYIYLINAPSINTFINYGFPEYQVYTYFSYGKTPWSNWGNSGYYLMLFIYIFKHLLTFVIETFLNVFSLVLFQRHLAHKAKLTGGATVMARTNRTMETEGSASLNISQAQARPVKDEPAANNSKTDSGAGDRKMANLVLIMSITGFIQSILLFIYTLYSLIFTKPTVPYRSLQFCAFFSTTFRHAINFVQCFFFNTNFRKEALIFFAKFKVGRVQPSS
jgi:hypothetical protein